MSKSDFTVNSQLRLLRWRLLLSSLGIIGCTLVAFIVVVYQIVAQSLEQKSDRQLNVLADAAAHSLPEIITNQGLTNITPSRVIDHDGDLDIPWQDLRQDQQSVEWFDEKGQLVGQAGHLFPSTPLILNPDLPYETHQNIDGKDGESIEIHRLTVPVYLEDPTERAKLQGYVRVSESIEAVSEELERVRSGLRWGSLLALILSGIGSWWLTQQSLQPIDRSIRQLKQFTADASHELRNPLTAIKASVEVMQNHEERFHASDLKKLEAIASATNQMSQLVDDLLWLARTDRLSGSSSSRCVIPIADLLEEVLDQYLPQAERKNIMLKATIQTDATVLGDPSRLKRLFGNLITNALHYTPEGGTVTLSSEVEDHEVIIQVTDTGIGIVSEQLPFIFDRFWRADQARGWREGGSGLGLSIALAIAHQHEGLITVRSQLGQGSCFQVMLPID
ncbi:MAG: HAMP domain-containing sensor histidine kinase [Oculatellaceae cyanobacterium bins.114]|nr:HAMP domain-containing sensor histidine kinase [Oculatellaceae cyanobacterium bins.114]